MGPPLLYPDTVVSGLCCTRTFVPGSGSDAAPWCAGPRFLPLRRVPQTLSVRDGKLKI